MMIKIYSSRIASLLCQIPACDPKNPRPVFRVSRGVRSTGGVRLFFSLASAIAVLLGASSLQAAVLYWDTNATTIGLGNTAGTWGTSAFIANPGNGGVRTAILGNLGTAATVTTAGDNIFFGTDNLALTGGATTIGTTGTLNININNITFGAGQTSSVTLTAGGTITLLTGTGVANTGAAPSITVSNSSDTIAATVAGSAGMVKLGAGTLVLTGTNTYTGTTTISAGTLQVGNGTLGNLASGALTFNGGGGTLNFNEPAGSTQAMGALTFTAGEGTVQSVYGGSGNTALNFASLAARAVGATGNLVISGGTNGTTNKITITTGASTATLLDKGLFFNGSRYAAYDVGGFVRAYGLGDANFQSLAGGADMGVRATTDNVSLTGSLTTQGASAINTINLGANSIAMTGTSLVLQTNGLLSSGSATIGGGTTPRLQSATAGGEMVIRVDGSSDALAIASIIQNNASASSLTKSGAGTLTLSGANTYTGTTRINSGTLVVSGGSAIADAGAVVLANAAGATFQLNSNETIGNVSGGGLAGGNVNIGDNTLTFGDAANQTFDGNFIGTSSGALIKQGAGTLTFNNPNTFAGTITINAGALSLAAISVNVAANTPYSASSGGAINLANGTSLNLLPAAFTNLFTYQAQSNNPNGMAYSNAINVTSGTANIKTGGGNGNRIVLSGNVTGTGTGALTLAILQNNLGTTSGGHVETFSGVISDGTGTLGLNVDFQGGPTVNSGAYISLSGRNTFTGNIMVSNTKGLVSGGVPGGNGGYFTIGSERTNSTTGLTTGNGALGWNGTTGNYTGTISLATGTFLSYASSSNQTLGGAISGGGGLIKDGTGALILSGINTYSGSTNVNAGSLTLADTGGLKFVVTDAAANKVTGAGSATINGIFSVDTSAVTVSSGSWTLVNTTTKSFGGTFGLTGFSGPVGNLYSKSAAGKNWTFDKSTGVLSLISDATITAFGIPGSVGVINQANKTIALNVPYTPWAINGLATLAPTFTLTSGTCNQTSGSPPSPTFAATNPATYTVTDGPTVNNYTVTVTVAQGASACAMLTCDFGAAGQALIDEAAGTVMLTVPPSQQITSLAPTFTLSANASINPASGSTRDFTSPVVYRVTAENGSTFKDYTVSVLSYDTWGHSGSLFILTTPAGANLAAGASVSNFPLLLRLNSSNFNFADAQSDGRDLRLTTAAGVALPYQIEQWDPVGGTAAVWVKIPTITGNSTQEIKMYWGKTGVGSVSSGSSVFGSSNGYASVIHLGDTLTDEIGTTTPTNANTTASNGLIGRARTFASGQGVLVGNNNIIGLPTGAGPFSTGVWIRPATSGTTVLGWGKEQGQGKIVIALPSPPRIRVDGYFGGADVSGTASIPTAQWTYVVHTFQSNGTRLYVNGVLDATTNGGTMNLPTPASYFLGNWGTPYNYVGDMDEVRISNVVRSADWVKLEYENQKPQQTLIGGIVPSGSGFSVSPSSVTVNEGASTTLTAYAGGAQKIYWIYKKNGQETVLATDQLTLTYTAARVSADDSAVIQFKAVFADGTQTIDVPLTVLNTVPDPAFTLVPSTTQWDGRQTMTVTANITNLAEMQAAGFATLNYNWSVSGVAVAKHASNGTLTLTRSQGSGPMTVTLTMNNGGTPVTNNTTINVQEPAIDAWVERTPDANEKPVDKQFFARNPETGLGTIHYRGTQAGATDAYLKVYTTDTGSDVLSVTYRQAGLVGGVYSFAAPIAAGKVTYKVTFGTTTGGVDSAPVATVSDLVCGDAFLIEGQSNALATDNSVTAAPAPSPWIRTYGLTLGWGNAVNKSSLSELQLGVWGMFLAQRLLVNNNMPICIINGAVGGTRIDVHRPNPANHSIPFGSGYGESSYANLYNRIVGAKLTHGIRAVLWHQGEQDQGAGGPDGDYDYKFYQQYFVDISSAWKSDFPNIRNYYFFQIWPGACGDTSRNDQLREVQRTMPRLFSNMKMMSTLGFSPGSACHYDGAGYQVFSDRIGPLVEQDTYGYVPPYPLTAPNLQRAYFTTSAKNEIALVFDQNTSWNVGATTTLFLANSSGATSGSVSSGSATGNTIKLQVSGATSASTITYVKGLVTWQQANLLYGSNGIAALTFADVAIGPPPTETSAVGGVNQVALAWAAVTGATSYKVKRATSVNGPFTTIATSSGTAYTDHSVSAGITYFYTVSGVNMVGNSNNEGLDSNTASATPSSAYDGWSDDPALGLTVGVNDDPEMDPDQDGIPNLMEFVLSSQPMSSSTSALPSMESESSEWSFEYNRNDASLPPATTQVVQYSDDLISWTDITIPSVSSGDVVITQGSPSDHVRVVIPALDGKVFARLKVTP